jgi:hypothetical protein
MVECWESPLPWLLYYDRTGQYCSRLYVIRLVHLAVRL